jgi:hypothetical protein
MNVPALAALRRGALLLATALLPLAAVPAAAPAPAASQPSGPTVGADIKSQCAAMSGDERTACERDIRSAAKTRRSHHHHATAPATAASASH